MPIPESQLETWARPGASTTAKTTADSIKNALNSYRSWPSGVEFDVYLQGSYKNDTHIRGDSDVDVVVQLNSTFHSNLSEEQKGTLGISPASYHLSDFRVEVLKVLRNYYGQGFITEGTKTLKLRAGNGRLSADIVVCGQYRKYKTVNSYDYVEGMCFWSGSRQIINYPKIHYENGVTKHKNTSEWYKPTVRIFKNLRSNLLGDNPPSYFLECLVYNAPHLKFGNGYQNSFCNIVNWLNEADLDTFMCKNGQHKLFGDSPEQWNTIEARSFIANVISIWNDWQ